MSFWEAVVSYYSDLRLENLPISEPENLLWVILGLYIGMVFALLASFLVRSRLGTIVDSLVDRGAVTPETAVTPAEGGFDRPSFLRELRQGKLLRKTICAVLPEEQEKTASDPLDSLRTARFYLPADRCVTAQKRFSRKGNGLGAILLAFALITVSAVLLYLLLPLLLQLSDNAITMLRR